LKWYHINYTKGGIVMHYNLKAMAVLRGGANRPPTVVAAPPRPISRNRLGGLKSAKRQCMPKLRCL